MIHHRECLPLVVKACEHLRRIHAELYNFKSHAPANGLELFGQIDGAHAPFAQRLNDPVAAEVLIPRHDCGSDKRLSLEVVGTDTPKGALDQALRAQSRWVVRPQNHSALRAVWHVGRNSHLMPYGRGCNLQRPIPYSWQVSPIGTGPWSITKKEIRHVKCVESRAYRDGGVWSIGDRRLRIAVGPERDSVGQA